MLKSVLTASNTWGWQIVIAVCVSLLATLPTLVLSMPIAALGLPILTLATIFAFRFPVVICMTFMIFSFFRIHEVFPILYPLRIPQALAIGALSVLGWHLFLKKSIHPFWRRELTAFGVMFTLVTIGVLFASNRSIAINYWFDTYIKIGMMTVATAWLLRKPSDFAFMAQSIALAGILVSCVALYNKVSGIGLVEGTRVTIGRNIGSVLGDPNDLSLVLLFPLSFAASLVVHRTGWISALVGVIGVGLIAAAIIATQSRGGLLGMVTVFAVIGSQTIKSKAALAMIAAVAFIGLTAAAGISQRSSGGKSEQGIDESAMGRIYAWGAATRMATSRPLTGVGINNFVPNYFAYSDHWDGRNHAVHSTWFGVLGETGFPGLIAFVSMVGIMVASAIRSNRVLEAASAPKSTRAAALAALAGIAGFCVSGTFLTQGFTWPIYILLAVTAAIGHYSNDVAPHTTLKIESGI